MSIATTRVEPVVLYTAKVMHRRRIAPFYYFVYRLFYLLLDIDRVAEASSSLRLFSYNRFNLISFHDEDHGDGMPGGLRHWAESLLLTRHIDLQGGRIRLLCLPRVFGFTFNPLSLWYCEHADGRLLAVLAEVNNTFGESHCYVISPTVEAGSASSDSAMTYGKVYEKEKCFHVSPLMDMTGSYAFRFGEPDARLRVAIHESREGRPLLDATLAGERLAWRDTAILKLLMAMPLMTLKVVAAIHWQALKIWLRGARFHSKPAHHHRGVS